MSQSKLAHRALSGSIHKGIKMKTVSHTLVALAASLGLAQSAHAVDIAVDQDVMTSVFFTGTDLVRGYAEDANRPVMRVSNHNTNGMTGAETIYLTFDYDFSTFTGPVVATLTMQSAEGGFCGDAGPGNPFTVSAHGVDLDPLASITDDTNPGGTVSWLNFYNNNILAADTAAYTSIDGYGTVTFDVSALVNSWVDGSNAIHAIAFTGKNDTSGNQFLHGFLNNDNGGTAMGYTFLTVTAVPEPETYAMLLAGLGMTGWMVRRRKHLG